MSSRITSEDGGTLALSGFVRYGDGSEKVETIKVFMEDSPVDLVIYPSFDGLFSFGPLEVNAGFPQGKYLLILEASAPDCRKSLRWPFLNVEKGEMIICGRIKSPPNNSAFKINTDIQFRAEVFTSLDPEGIVSIDWRMGNGQRRDGKVFNFRYNLPGRYLVRLKVTYSKEGIVREDNDHIYLTIY